ncbi:zinc finger protein 639-like, partial [Phocoena sinus]|uniref:zinc finger protein 639-like n=1 Tax=Phocoena sinus TaxID=42100 RepID=UPI0013C429BE
NDDDSDTETSKDLPKFTDGIKATNRNQNYLVPGPVLRVRDHTAFSTEKCADTEICDEECDSPESINRQTQEESPIEVHTAEGVPVAAEVRAVSEDYDIETENNSSESLQDQTDEEPPAKFCKILDKSEALNVTAQQKWPLLRANSSGLYKCELCLITEQSSPKEYVKLLCTSHAVKVGYGLWFMSYSTFIKPFQTCLAVFLARKLLDR